MASLVIPMVMVTMIKCLVFPAVIVAAVSEFTTASEEQIYQHHRLDKICPPNGGKHHVSLDTGVSVFTFTSLLMDTDVFKCHLELGVTSSSYGFSIFIEETTMEGSNNSGCHDDFIQFGRDILFVTSHKSPKYCGMIEPPVPREGNGMSGFTFPFTPLAKRIYAEERDKEMDIWVRVTTPPLGAKPKTLTLVVTPFKKSCRPKDLYYRQCRYSTKCIRKELFCDGRVNCAWPYTEPADEVYCKEVSLPAKETWKFSDLSTVLIVILIIVLVLTALYCGIVKFRTRIKTVKKNSSADEQRVNMSRQVHRVSTAIPQHFLPSCPPHPPSSLPPPYTEVCLPPVVPVDPPKYSALPQQN